MHIKATFGDSQLYDLSMVCTGNNSWCLTWLIRFWSCASDFFWLIIRMLNYVFAFSVSTHIYVLLDFETT
jgi:hypothetical protein